MYDVESLLSMTALIDAPGDEKVTIYFRQQLPNAPDFLTMFSVKGFSTSELKGRAIVSHTGMQPLGGTWKCSKHADGTLCLHVRDAFDLFHARRRFIGPDLADQGLFNFNNSIIISHELLNEYTMAFVTSETPFNAFVATVAHRYLVSGAEFMGDDLFRSVWFAYATHLAMDNDMCCTRCGICPDTVIWDGITLAFGRKHLSATLIPPTQTSATSLQRSNVKNHPRQQLLLDPALRKLIRQVVNAPKLEDLLVKDVEEGLTSDAAKIELDCQSRQVVEHLARVDAVYAGLEKECKPLALLFLEAYGAAAFSQKKSAPSTTTRFFLQIAAEESILQMINGAALVDLGNFMATPLPKHLTKLLSIPGLYRVLKAQSSISEFTPLLKWLAKRATTVLQDLSVERLSLTTGAGAGVSDSNWKVSPPDTATPHLSPFEVRP
ncbi:hypothetical protein EST38_g12997 [Candolleomyces aberdarensis]|uniref:HMG domain-containing protein n=1 Tax=Candolleomyces aberdarensis TaxID=2316362 RepID=A0A4Q2D405_9AGAR|nr:hypothetical protein EST38_g12997 [Candolleomyces aberdarensis]